MILSLSVLVALGRFTIKLLNLLGLLEVENIHSFISFSSFFSWLSFLSRLFFLISVRLHFLANCCFYLALLALAPPVGLLLQLLLNRPLTNDFSHADHDARDSDQAFRRRSELGGGSDARPVHAAVEGQLQPWRTSGGSQ